MSAPFIAGLAEQDIIFLAGALSVMATSIIFVQITKAKNLFAAIDQLNKENNESKATD